MGNKGNLNVLIILKEKLDAWRNCYNEEYLKKLSDEDAREYKLMTTIKEETLEEKGKNYFGDISLKEIETKLEEEIKRRARQKREEFFDTVIPLKEEYDKDQNNSAIFDQIIMLFTNYYENVMCITKSAILSMIDNEIKERRKKAKRINSSCYQAIVDLEKKINNPDGYMEDVLWKTRSFYNKKRNLAVDSDSQDNMHKSKEDVSYSLKGN